MLKLLCITAHPDDEAGNFGGTLLHYHARGVDTRLICLTPGQAATHRGSARSDAELAAMRRKEFAASCEILKISGSEVLDYRDGALDRTDLNRVVEDLVLRIRRLRPQVVMTYGPEGAVTAHPDHSMASIFATMAFHWAGRSNRYTHQLANGLPPHRAQKLYYATAPSGLPDRQPVSLAPVTAILDVAPYFETKIAAFRAHSTQAPLFPIFDKAIRKRGTQEWFHLAATLDPRPLQAETDLFIGVEDE